SGDSPGSAGATVTYEYAIIAKNTQALTNLSSLFQVGGIVCPEGDNSGVCAPEQPTPLYYIPNAVKVTGNYQMSYDGTGDAEINVLGFGDANGPGAFDLTCGYSANPTDVCNSNNNTVSGVYATFGAVTADADSLAANAFYGFLTISASARILESADVFAMVDP